MILIKTIQSLDLFELQVLLDGLLPAGGEVLIDDLLSVRSFRGGLVTHDGLRLNTLVLYFQGL